MEETKPVIEWHQFKDSHVAICGDEIIAIIEPIEDFPCKAFTFKFQQGVYLTAEAALLNAVKFLEDQEADSQPEA